MPREPPTTNTPREEMAAQQRSTAHNMTCGETDSALDVILRIDKVHVPHIVSGKKNHEYRDYILDDKVTHVWLYINEDKTIQHVLTIGAYKTPGQVNDPEGQGNHDFDLGLKKSRFGYPILEVHALPCPLDRTVLLNDYGVDMFRNGKQYAKAALVEAFPVENLARLVPQ